MLGRWLQIEILKEHKILMLMIALLWGGMVLLCVSCYEERTDADKLLDEWCSVCEGMNYEEICRFYETQTACLNELKNGKIMHIEDYRKIKLYDTACSEFRMMLQNMYQTEQMRQFAADETDYVEKSNHLEWDIARYRVYQTLPRWNLLNKTYFLRYSKMQKYNVTFIIAILLCCGIWSDVGRNGGFKVEKISVNGRRLQARRHLALILMIVFVTLSYSAMQVLLSGMLYQWNHWGNAARAFLNDAYTWQSIRQLLWGNFVLQLLNNMFWYVLTYILCLCIRDTKKIYITMTGIVLVLYFLMNCLARYGQRSFMLIGYYQNIYALTVAKPLWGRFTTFHCGILILAMVLLGAVAVAVWMQRREHISR